MAEVQRDTVGSTEDTIRFLEMVGLFGSQAMVALGKVMNPATGKSEKHLPVAKLFIDTLEMLERKTQGNLNKDEARTLRSTLTDLRMMYIEETKASDKPAEPQPEPQPEITETTSSADAKPSTETEDESKVKFHKKYE